MIRLADIGEDALIQRLIRLLPHAAAATGGPGDDCAVVDPGPGHASLQLLKTDVLVEHIHFLPAAPPRAVGWKACARVVSDFAAMGGHPDRFLITLALPAQTPVAWAEELYRGIGDCLARFGGALAGGETSSVPPHSAAVISIAATGHVRREHLTLRSTAHSGHALLVTGTLGGSHHGKHLAFSPRMEETDWLVSHFKPTAMMDLSDGLGRDLPRLAAASGCGFVLERAALPVTAGSTVEQALGEGEDFELLLALEDARVPALLAAWAGRFPTLPLTRIGCLVEAGAGDTLSGGWEHFSKSGA